MFGGGGAASVSPRPAVFVAPAISKPTASRSDENLSPARASTPARPIPSQLIEYPSPSDIAALWWRRHPRVRCPAAAELGEYTLPRVHTP